MKYNTIILPSSSFNINLKHYKNEIFNAVTLENDIKTAQRLLSLNKINETIMDNLIDIFDNSIEEIDVSLEDRNNYTSNITPNVFTFVYKFNSDIRDDFFKKIHKKSVFEMLENFNEINNIVFKKNEKQYYISFNFYYGQISERYNNIEIFNKLEGSSSQIMTIGETYWIGQPRKNKIKKPIKTKLLNIVREYDTYTFIFEGISEENSPYTIINTSLFHNYKNSNELQDHIVINKHIDYFIIDFLKEINQDLSLVSSSEKEVLKESMREITNLF